MKSRDKERKRKPFWRPRAILRSKSAGYLSLFLGLISLGLSLYLGIILFKIATYPLISNSYIKIQGEIFHLLFVFVAFNIVFGILLAFIVYGYRLVLEYKGLGFFFIIIPSMVAFLVLMFSGFTEDVNHLRIYLKIAIIPLIGYSILLYAFSGSHIASQAISKVHNGRTVIKKLFILQLILTLWVAILLDWFLMDYKVAGAYLLFPIFLILGSMFIIESAYIFNICNIHIMESKDVMKGKEPWGKKIFYRKAKTDQRRSNNILFATIGIITAILLLIFLPPLNVVIEGPDLEINKAEGELIINGSKKSTRSLEGLRVDIIIVNNGGITATGVIEVKIHNNSFNKTIDITKRLDGFGLWHIKGDIPFDSPRNLSEKEDPRLDYNATLIHNGKILEEKEIVPIPNPCSMWVIILTFLIVTIWITRKRR